MKNTRKNIIGIITCAVLVTTVCAQAQPHHHGHGGPWGHNSLFTVLDIVNTAAHVVEAVRPYPAPVVVNPAPVVTAPAVAAPVVTQPVVAAPVVTQPVVAAPATVVTPAPVVAQPVVTAPVVVQPAPVVVQPAPVVVRPAPVVVRPAPIIVRPGFRHHHVGPHRW